MSARRLLCALGVGHIPGSTSDLDDPLGEPGKVRPVFTVGSAAAAAAVVAKFALQALGLLLAFYHTLVKD